MSDKRKPRPKPPTPGAAHEAKCRRCGRCCRDKYIIGDRMYYGESWCKHFDPETKLCRIYEQRHELNPQCLSVEKGIELGVFPADCPYVADLPDYTPPVDMIIDNETLRLVESGKLRSPEEVEEHVREKQPKARKPRAKRPRKRKRA